jgi:hypothetical protein
MNKENTIAMTNVEKRAAWILEKFHCFGYNFPLYYRGIDYSPERF